MTKMKHENVVRLYGVVLDTKSVMLVSELAPCGSLLECVQKPALRTSFPVDVLCSFAVQIAKGMQYLASERLIHRDLAARNVLVFSSEKVKISDFGLSRSLGVGEDYYRSEFNPSMKLPIAWCAPESINFLRFTEKSDVWSFGVTLFEMFSYGEMPWHGYNGAQILNAIDRQGKRLDCPEACPTEFYSIMQKCWAHLPDDRPTFDQLVSCLPSMMPQLLITVTELPKTDRTLLGFKRNEIIILINRCPGGIIDGDFWLGAMRDGQIGLFKPADTVAYLGAESPNPGTAIMKNGPIIKKKDLKQAKIPLEQKKLMISEPQGDVRHTCHVGIDGQSFGLLQVDKKELSKALPPSFPIKIEGEANSVPPRPTPRKLPISTATPVRHISSEKNIFPIDLDSLEKQNPPPVYPRGMSSPPQA
uniref:Non-specific protein-tyrosine kinase n=1 Tax=Panagrolaimus sp. JU765 TaxID=591449 RepID=A0AC34QCH1_9BILA